MFSKNQFSKFFDYTILKPTAIERDIINLCNEAMEYNFASVCIFPYWVKLAHKTLIDSVAKVSTVIDFPYGAGGKDSKVAESQFAIENGARELDVVINISALKSGDTDAVYDEIKEIVDCAKSMSSDDYKVSTKFIIECCYLTDEEKKTASRLVMDAGGDYVKTSTGTGPQGAKVEDLAIIKSVVGEKLGIKAAGGIRTAKDAVEMINAGATRIGTSSAARIVTEYIASHPEYANG
ncbi:MAG: deoxyribose-phosphate aldolase [Armatimonadota bacterium]